MKKKFIVFFSITFFSLLLLGLGVGIFFGPSYLYRRVLTEGIDSPYLSFEKLPPYLFDGQTVDIPIPSEFESKEGEQWVSFPFENFLVPLPLGSLRYKLHPILEKSGLKTEIGLQVISPRDFFFLSFKMGPVIRPQLDLGKDKIFGLPYFSSFIEAMSLEKIWEDLYTKKISLLQNQQKLTLKEMVYNLFLLKTRKKIFKEEEIVSFSYFPKVQAFIGRMKYAQKGSKKEVISFFSKGQVFSYYLETVLNQERGEYLRAKIINEVLVEKRNPDKAIGLYARFKNLSFAEKIDQVGMIHLFSAWSLDRSKVNFIKEIVRYQKRGKMERSWLGPFFFYSKKDDFKKDSTFFEKKK